MKLRRIGSVGLFAFALFGAAQLLVEAQTRVMRVIDSRVKIGGDTTAPESVLEIVGDTGTVGTGNSVIVLKNAGPLAFQLNDTATDPDEFWNFSNANSETEFRISKSGTGVTEFMLDDSGNLTIEGQLTTAGDTYPDYVFEDDYRLMTLDEVEAFIDANRHLPNVPPAEELKDRVNMSRLQRILLEKVEELTLYTIQQQRRIEELQTRLDAIEPSSATRVSQ